MRLRSPYTPTAERTSMKFRPLHDRVVIRRSEGDPVSEDGIIIPDTAKEKPQQGEVVAHGPYLHESGKLVPLDMQTGNLILFGKWFGPEEKIDGEDLLIMKEADILGIVEIAAAVDRKKVA